MAPTIITRSEAIAQGLVRYYTAAPCKYGHIDERHTSSGTCITCGVLKLRKRYHENPEAGRARAKKWFAENREKALESSRRYRLENPEKRRAVEKRWREANPEKVKEMEKRARRKAALEHPERLEAARRKWLENPENKKARAATIAAWRKANPEKSRAITRNRRAKAKNSPEQHTAADIIRIGEAQGWKCHWCGKPTKKKYDVDHIVPLSKGGSNGPRNLAIACVACNRTKNAKHPIEFAQSLGLLL